jgi:deoxyribonuclease-1
MEADLHNLFPAIGEINRHRKNYEFGPIPGELRQYGDCDMEISVGDRIAEPPESARGRIARAYLYMETAYGIGLTGKERKLYLGWHRSYPPDHEERVRSDFIKDLQGNDNPFVHGYGLQEDPNFSRPGACLLQ